MGLALSSRQSRKQLAQALLSKQDSHLGAMGRLCLMQDQEWTVGETQTTKDCNHQFPGGWMRHVGEGRTGCRRRWCLEAGAWLESCLELPPGIVWGVVDPELLWAVG